MSEQDGEPFGTGERLLLALALAEALLSLYLWLRARDHERDKEAVRQEWETARP